MRKSCLYKSLLNILILLFSGCSTRVWVQEKTPSTGIIGYQNYDPRSDGGKKITDLVHCSGSHKMTLNRIRTNTTGAITYMIKDELVIPLDDGITKWAEYHYECNDYAEDNNEAVVSYISSEDRIIEKHKISCLEGNASDCVILSDYFLKEDNKEESENYNSRACLLKHLEHSPKPCFISAQARLLANDYVTAKKMLEASCDLLDRNKGNYMITESCGFLSVYNNDKKLFNRVKEEIISACNIGSIDSCFNFACMNSKLGNFKETIFYLNKALELGLDNYNLIVLHPSLENFRKTKRYNQLLKDLRTKIQATSNN